MSKPQAFDSVGMQWHSGMCILTSSPYARRLIFELIVTIHRYKSLWIVAGFSIPADDLPLVVPRVSGFKGVDLMDKKQAGIKSSAVQKFEFWELFKSVYPKESQILQVTKIFL